MVEEWLAEVSSRKDLGAKGNCAHHLLALLWITCSLYPTGLYLRGLERPDQKTTNIYRKVPIGISHGFCWFFKGLIADFPTFAVGCSVDKLFAEAGEARRGWAARGLFRF